MAGINFKLQSMLHSKQFNKKIEGSIASLLYSCGWYLYLSVIIFIESLIFNKDILKFFASSTLWFANLFLTLLLTFSLLLVATRHVSDLKNKFRNEDCQVFSSLLFYLSLLCIMIFLLFLIEFFTLKVDPYQLFYSWFICECVGVCIIMTVYIDILKKIKLLLTSYLVSFIAFFLVLLFCRYWKIPVEDTVIITVCFSFAVLSFIYMIDFFRVGSFKFTYMIAAFKYLIKLKHLYFLIIFLMLCFIAPVLINPSKIHLNFFMLIVMVPSFCLYCLKIDSLWESSVKSYILLISKKTNLELLKRKELLMRNTIKNSILHLSVSQLLSCFFLFLVTWFFSKYIWIENSDNIDYCIYILIYYSILCLSIINLSFSIILGYYKKSFIVFLFSSFVLFLTLKFNQYLSILYIVLLWLSTFLISIYFIKNIRTYILKALTTDSPYSL